MTFNIGKYYFQRFTQQTACVSSTLSVISSNFEPRNAYEKSIHESITKILILNKTLISHYNCVSVVMKARSQKKHDISAKFIEMFKIPKSLKGRNPKTNMFILGILLHGKYSKQLLIFHYMKCKFLKEYLPIILKN